VEIASPPTWHWFASGGYYPAPRQRLFCRLEARLRAGGKPVRLENHGPAVTLSLEGKTYPSLGEVVEEAFLPVRASRRTLHLPAGSEGTHVFLFELPAAGGTGQLQIEWLGRVEVTLPVPPEAGVPQEGEYVEALPRNLKPLLTDPVISAILSAPETTLQIRQDGKILRLRVTKANVVGRTRGAETSCREMVLHNGPHSLSGWLRALPDQRIILYLGDAPMHQITYRRPAQNEEARPPDGEKASSAVHAEGQSGTPDVFEN
jgi:hypothetical protein